MANKVFHKNSMLAFVRGKKKVFGRKLIKVAVGELDELLAESEFNRC